MPWLAIWKGNPQLIKSHEDVFGRRRERSTTSVRIGREGFGKEGAFHSQKEGKNKGWGHRRNHRQ